MEEFIYNQMVTNEDLNEIAIDLGAGDFSVFDSGTTYAVDKLNEITSTLVSSGITVAMNKFELSVSEAGIVVGTGIAIFESGKKIKLTEPVTLGFKSGELYLYEKPSTGMVSLNIGELPNDNYIHIATINDDFTFVDRRTIAKAKVELPTECSSYSFTETFLLNDEVDQYNAKTLSIPIEGVSKIFIKSKTETYNRWCCFCYYDVKKQSFTGLKNDSPPRIDDYKFIEESESIYLYFDWGSVIRTIGLKVVEQSDTSVTFEYNILRTGNYFNEGELKVEYTVFGGVEK